MKKIYSAVLLISFWTPASYGANLKDVFDVALKNDPYLSSSDYERQATAGDKSESCGKLFPQLALKAGYVDYDQSESGSVLGEGNVNSNGAISGTQSSVGATLSQPLLDLPKISDCKKWRAAVNRDNAEYELALEDLVYRVIVSYLDVLATQSKFAVATNQVKLFESLKNEMEQSVSRKVSTKRELFSVTAKLNNAKANKISAENKFLSAKENLKNIFKSDIAEDKLLVVREDVLLKLEQEADPEHWAEIAEKSNLRVIKSELSEKIFKNDLKAKQGKHAPTIDAFANHTEYDSDIDQTGTSLNSNDRFSTEAFGVRLNWKLFAGGSDQGSIKAAKNRYRSAKKQSEAERDEVRLNAKNSARNLEALKAQIDASSALLDATKSDYDAIKTGLDSRTRTKTDLLNATLDLVDAKSKLGEARYNYVKGVLDFWKAIGSLSADRIEQIDELFIEPEDDAVQFSKVEVKK
jgi:TolC family type I secretion outer membrane protein